MSDPLIKSIEVRERRRDITHEGTSEPFFFRLGDYVAGILTGILTALAVRLIVGPQWDMVVAMLVGMGVGMLVHMTLLLLFTPLLGMFEVMMPLAMIGMYGGMLFGMRDSMQQAYIPLSTALIVGGVFGVFVVFVAHWWNRQLRGAVFARPEARRSS